MCLTFDGSSSELAPLLQPGIFLSILFGAGQGHTYRRPLPGDKCLPFTFPFLLLCCVCSVLGSTGFTFFVFDPLDIEVIIRDIVFARGLRTYISESTHEEETCRTGQYVYQSKANIF